MALKVELKANERFIVGNSLITNGNQRTHLYIKGNSPVLREKDILTEDTADSPAKKIYFAVQIMYLEEDTEPYREGYFNLVNDFITAAPSSLPIIVSINNQILTGSLYKALREAKQLIAYEKEIMSNGTTGSSHLSASGSNQRRSSRA